MKKSIYSILLYIFIFAFSIRFFSGIELPSDPLYLFVTVLSFSIAVLLHKPILKFLTVKVNFLTFWLSAGLLSLATFYLLNFILPGFFVSASSFETVSYNAITIEAFEMSALLTQASASFLFAGLCAMMEALSSSD